MNSRIMDDDWIEGEKVILRPMTPADTELVVNWRNQEYVRQNFIYQRPFTVSGHLKWTQTMIDTGQAVQFIIYEKQTNRPIGSTYLRDIDYEFQKAEYGIFIGEKNATGKGYGTEVARHMIEYAFFVLGLHKVSLRLFADNKAAEKSYKKAGFFKEAYLRDEVRIGGIYRDVVLMARICEENV